MNKAATAAAPVAADLHERMISSIACGLLGLHALCSSSGSFLASLGTIVVDADDVGARLLIGTCCGGANAEPCRGSEATAKHAATTTYFFDILPMTVHVFAGFAAPASAAVAILKHEAND